MVLIKLGFGTKRTRFETPLEPFSAEVVFARLWGFPKIVLALKCRLACGTKSITLEQMVNVAKAIPRLGLLTFLPKFADKRRGTRALNALC